MCKWIISAEDNKVFIGMTVMNALCMVHPISIGQVLSNHEVCKVLVDNFLDNDGKISYDDMIYNTKTWSVIASEVVCTLCKSDLVANQLVNGTIQESVFLCILLKVSHYSNTP